MKRMLPAVFVASTLAFGVTLSAQLNFPDIPYDAVDPLTANLPQDTYLGEAAGVASLKEDSWKLRTLERDCATWMLKNWSNPMQA